MLTGERCENHHVSLKKEKKNRPPDQEEKNRVLLEICEEAMQFLETWVGRKDDWNSSHQNNRVRRRGN